MMNIDTTSTVLVIDDELGPRESLRFLLKNEYRVLCANSVNCGLELLQENHPDVVILDIRMPDRNGIEGLREIRRLDADVAVIMLTGYSALDTAQDAVRLEANDYMEKPFDAAAMRCAVKRHIARTRVRRQREKVSREAEQLQQRLADELRRYERFAELGQASAEFVHDIRNAFTVLSGSAELLRIELIDAPQVPAMPSVETVDNLGMLNRTVRRCGELLDTWQRLIHHDPSAFTTVDLCALAREVAVSCQPLAQAAHARIVCEQEHDNVLVVGDPVQLSRAIANIVNNAIQALPPSDGVVQLVVARDRRDAANACLRVIDNGCGISPEHIEQVFNAEFTTKRSRGGKGLGLFIVRKIIEGHGGCVTASSEVGRGATLTLTVPLAGLGTCRT
ncbi:MAG: sensor histidine kinase [Kiritimatiellia bacterium]